MKQAAAPQATSLLVPRALNLKLGDDVPTYWFAGNPFLTHYMNAFSGVLPEGERFMIASVRSGRRKLADDHVLQKDISGFIGQEAYHAREHKAFNDLMQSRGYAFDKLDRFAAFSTKLMLKLPEKDQMAITGAVEHLTAMFGKVILANPEVVEQVHPSVRPLMVWHSIEELEHKSVAFDLFVANGGGYWRRVEGLLIVTFVISLWVMYGQLLFMWRDRSLFNLRAMAKGWWWMFGFGTHAGYMRKSMGDYFRFFRPGYHPSQDESEQMIATWQPRLDQMLQQQVPVR